MDRQTNRNSNTVVNDCTYIKTINILNTVNINKKKKHFQDKMAQILRNAGQTREIIYKLSTLVTILDPNVLPWQYTHHH